MTGRGTGLAALGLALSLLGAGVGLAQEPVLSAQVASMIQEEAFDHLDAPVLRVTQADVPMPYALNLEDSVLPTEARVIDAVKRVAYAK